ncbi:MAG: damage-control phosphatase ARMT1 family protein [Promethearchaeota archaeon]|jgi:uncharacterized protein with ATP-grasp and redox domains
MKLEPECIGCIFNQVLKAFDLLRPDISREIIVSTQKKLMDFLQNFDFSANASPILGKVAYGIISDVLNQQDPYKTLKQKYNQLALDQYDEIKKIIKTAEDPLFEAILVSAIGNTIDLASQHEIDMISDIKCLSDNNLVINDYNEFKKSLKNAKHLLIIGDNAGEIVFDKLLVITIMDLYPNLEIIYSVREAPIINDATMEDAKFISLTKLVKVVESSATPGVDIDSSSDEFKKIFFQKRGLILSKGQGNFESLYGVGIPDKDVYYLLKVKCNLMERIFGARIGDLIFKKKGD